MTVWQLNLYLASGLERIPDISNDGWQPPILLDAEVRQGRLLLAKYLGQPWSLANGWEVFGPENGNRIDVISATLSTASLIARFDLRDNSAQFQTLVCRLARELTCELFSPHLNAIIQPDLKPLKMALNDMCSESH